MKKIMLSVVLSAVTMAVTCSPLFAANRSISVVSKRGQSVYLYQDYQALVVGVSDYEQWPKLPNAAKDAIEVADKLNELGVHVKLVLNPTYRELKTALTDMVYTMGHEPNRGILFFYAGHGETETLADRRKMGYIVPKDCPLLKEDPAGFANHAISMREIESASLRIRSKHVLMLFDSCFSGALFALVRAVPHDITEKSALPVRQYITAGREDEEVPDQSMFKRCLLIGLEGDADLTGDGYITGSELGMYLSDKVVNYTHRQQHPQYGKSNNPDLDRGDFVFSLNMSFVSTGPKPTSSDTSESQRLAEERARLERQRRELEEIKELIAERKRLEEERKHIDAEGKRYDTARFQSKQEQPPASPTLRNGEISREGRFIAYADGTVLDTKTKLMWGNKDNGKESFFGEAENYCKGYQSAGYWDWRMPTADELETIFDKGATNSYGYHVTGLIGISGIWVWCKHGWWGGCAAINFREGSVAVDGNFVGGGSGGNKVNTARALPVRDSN